MAEIRKFDPAAGNAIAQALKAAMGEPVRPVTPGGPPVPRAQGSAPATRWVQLTVATPEPAATPDDQD